MANKRLFWLKLKEDFFQQKAMKKLRRMEHGEVLTIIYLKMQLASLRNGGMIIFEGLGDSLDEELALQLDEQESDVHTAVEFLMRYRLMEQIKNEDIYMLPSAVENTGSESDSAARVRALRERATLQCNATKLHCNATTAQCDARERDREETEKEAEGESVAAPPPTHPRFVPPTLEEVTEYVRERGSKVDPQVFIDFYTAKGWMIGKTPMKDWKAACRNAEGWERWDKPADSQSRKQVKAPTDYDSGESFV